MALSVGRAALLIGLGWAGLVSALLPPPQHPVRRFPGPALDHRGPEQLRARRLDILEETENSALRAMERRDSFMAIARRLHQADPNVLVNPVIDADSRARAMDLVRVAWRATHLGVALVPILVAIDTSGRSWESREYFLPTAPGEPCVAHIATGTRRDARGARRLVLHTESVQGLLGPCALYAAFGMPGPSIRDWLVHGGMLFGELPHAAGLSGAEDFAMISRLVRPDLPLDLMACRLGQTARCAAYLHRDEQHRNWWGYMYQPARVPGWLSLYGSGHAMEATLLSDLAAERGSAAMTAFWRSNAPLDSAFAAAFGEADGVWMARWVHGHLGWEPVETTWSSVTVTIGVIAVLVLIGAGAATRRQVGV